MTKTVDYTFGHDEVSQTPQTYDNSGNVFTSETLVFGHDSHGSVRILTDMAGVMAQMFAYDANGQMLTLSNAADMLISGGNGQLADASLAKTNLLYSDEQFDSRIGQQYLLARYDDPNTGRFKRLDPFFGNLKDPQSRHKYACVHADTINQISRFERDKQCLPTIAQQNGPTTGRMPTRPAES